MTKREKKFRKRLFAELHLNKREQLMFDTDPTTRYWDLYNEYKISKYFCASPSWLVGISLGRICRRMAKLGYSSDCDNSILMKSLIDREGG